jgi:hypothetical protein
MRTSGSWSDGRAAVMEYWSIGVMRWYIDRKCNLDRQAAECFGAAEACRRRSLHFSQMQERW